MSSGLSCFDWRNSTPRRSSRASHLTSSYLPFFFSVLAPSLMALILTSVGKLESIVEMLAIRNAPPPAKLSVSLRTSCFFQLPGTVQVIPCWSHFTSWPFAIAAVCAAVGFGFSTGSPPVTDLWLDDDGEDDEFVLLLVFNLLVRLHAAIIKTSATIEGICFIGSPLFAESESKRLLLHWKRACQLFVSEARPLGRASRAHTALASARASDTSPNVVF